MTSSNTSLSILIKSVMISLDKTNPQCRNINFRKNITPGYIRTTKIC